MEILIIVALIVFNGLCSMGEIALVSSKKFKLESLAKKGSKNAALALELSNNPNKFLSTVQMCITLIGILTGIFSGKGITDAIRTFLLKIAIIAPYANTIATIIVIALVTFFSIVFGELIPKRIGLLFPEAIAVKLSRPMNIVSTICKPFIWILTTTNDFIMRIFGIKEDAERVTEEEIKAMVQNGADDGEIQEIEHTIVERAFDLGDRKVCEIMTHRTDIKYVDISDTIDIIRKMASEELHSVYPVVDGELDSIKGMISIKELFTSDSPDISKFITKPIYVPENTAVYHLLEKFRESKVHLAIIVDEYGGVQGIATMDDVLDALVGDMSKKHHQEYKIDVRDEKSWFADAQYPFYEMLRYFDIPEEDSEGEHNTIAGLILDTLGKIPVVGDKIEWANFTIEVIDMDEMRIDKLLITRK
jgi:putative hemolysin